jgi:hypothetical protein
MSENLRYRLDRLNGGDLPRGCGPMTSDRFDVRVLTEHGPIDAWGPSHTTVKR